MLIQKWNSSCKNLNTKSNHKHILVLTGLKQLSQMYLTNSKQKNKLYRYLCTQNSATCQKWIVSQKWIRKNNLKMWILGANYCMSTSTPTLSSNILFYIYIYIFQFLKDKKKVLYSACIRHEHHVYLSLSMTYFHFTLFWCSYHKFHH
jgi:hypothetical protein